MPHDPPPIPPRFRWLKRLSVAALTLLLAVAGLRLYWGYRMERRLDAAVAALNAGGDTSAPGNARPEPIGDDENAAVLLQRALAAWPTVNVQHVIDSQWAIDPNQHPDPVDDNREYLARLAPVLEQLRRARAASGCDWKLSPANNQPAAMPPGHYGAMRRLARLLDDAAKRAHEAGDDRLGLELIDHMMTIADALEAPPPLLLAHLVGISIRAMATFHLEALVPTLAVGGGGGQATPAQVNALIERLLADDRARLSDSIRAERKDAFHTARALADGKLGFAALAARGIRGPVADLPPRLRMLLIKPLLQGDALLLLDWYAASAKAAASSDSLPTYHDAQTAMSPDVGDWAYRPWLHPTAESLSSGVNATTRTYYQHVALRRLASIALAIRRFQAERGRRPDSLEEMTPDYLPTVPRDPFAADGRPIAYKPKGVTPQTDPRFGSAPATPAAGHTLAILYSVGPDGSDDGGRIRLTNTGRIDMSSRYGTGDDLFFLLDPEPPPASAGAVTTPGP